ncbi:MAG: SprT-like domain-containing protein, partial [Candidatus Eremiobacteraeota bacterium]|nr:SprT-like domain-containing protein [Candidatus Eremiobacteraeota bacterium]
MLPDETTLQLLFAELNNLYFGGSVPACRIRYNARFSNSVGRTVYDSRPILIELSPKHFAEAPQALRETLLHEMIHAWLHARGEDPGHTPAFKKKMRECGLTSIYHDMGNAGPAKESRQRFILRCERCTAELLRKRKPLAPVSCGRCSPRRYDPRFPLTIYEVVEIRP